MQRQVSPYEPALPVVFREILAAWETEEVSPRLKAIQAEGGLQACGWRLRNGRGAMPCV